jgi:hypothetical protein
MLRTRLSRLTGVQLRSGVLFVTGLAGVAYETLVSASDRPTLLIMFAAMLGLPLFLKADEKSRATMGAHERPE